MTDLIDKTIFSNNVTKAVCKKLLKRDDTRELFVELVLESTIDNNYNALLNVVEDEVVSLLDHELDQECASVTYDSWVQDLISEQYKQVRPKQIASFFIQYTLQNEKERE